jgi:rhodanese-related sulfurtransferase
MGAVSKEAKNPEIIMNPIRQYGIIFFVVLAVVILVLVRSLSPGHFKQNARKLAEASFTNSNTMSREKLGTLRTSSLIVDLSDHDKLPKNPPAGAVNIPFRSLLEKAGQKVIHEFKGPVFLYSENPGTSAKAWIILSEMGYRNLYILTDEPDNEVMKYKFLPDTGQAGTL